MATLAMRNNRFCCSSFLRNLTKSTNHSIPNIPVPLYLHFESRSLSVKIDRHCLACNTRYLHTGKGTWQSFMKVCIINSTLCRFLAWRSIWMERSSITWWNVSRCKYKHGVTCNSSTLYLPHPTRSWYRVTITYVDREGDSHTVQGKVGDNVLYLAHRHGIEMEG